MVPLYCINFVGNYMPFKTNKMKSKKKKAITEDGQAKPVISEWRDIERAIDYLAKRKIDITKEEGDWTILSVALFDMYGEDGLEPFLMLSALRKGYEMKTASDLYIQHSSRSYCGRKDFFALLTKYGIQVKDI